MSNAREARLQLRRALEGTEIVIAPSASDAITARLIESLGIKAAHFSGSLLHRQAGYADASLLTMTEVVTPLSRMCAAVSLPVIADADTGFGGVANVARTVQEFERAGAAAMHIEDQLTPKRPPSGELAVDTITRREMIGKIKAAVDARVDDSFMIIARSEVRGDIDELVERLRDCIDAGADAAFIPWTTNAELLRDWILKLRSAISKPLIGIPPDNVTIEQYQSFGAACAIFPMTLEIAAINAKRAVLDSLTRTGNTDEYWASLTNGVEQDRAFVRSQGMAELDDLESRFA